MGLRFIITASEGTVAGAYMDILAEGEVVVIGRGEVDVRLPDPSVSLRHAEVKMEGEGYSIEDLGSRLGTRLNGARLERGRPVPLRVGDRIEAGAFSLSFEGEQEQVGGENTRMLARSLVRRLESGVGAEKVLPYLLVQNGPAAGARLELPEGRKLSIGRGRDCELLVDDARVSRVHARMTNRDGVVWLEDAGSANGTVVNGETIEGPVRLENGSRLKIGGVRLVVVCPGDGRLGLTAALGAVQGTGWPTTLGVGVALLVGGLGLLIAVIL